MKKTAQKKLTKPIAKKVSKIAKKAKSTKTAIKREAGHAQALVRDLQKLGSMTSEAAAESLDHAKKTVSAIYKKIDTGRLKDAKKDFSAYVKKHPLPLLCLAIGSGFLAGRLKKGR